jgi:acetoin utilization protein AcuB
MFVSDWMTKNVFTVGPADSVSAAIKTMKTNGIKHLPIVEGDALKGIVSDRDIKAFSPSSATTLDIHELHHLLAEIKIKEIMKGEVVTTSPGTPIEEAAMLLLDRGIGCLPVVKDGKLFGIISDRDIFRVLVDVTGVRRGGHRIYLIIEDRAGSLKEVGDVIREYGFSPQSILTSYEGIKEGCRGVIIRTKGRGNVNGLKTELEKRYRDITFITD